MHIMEWHKCVQHTWGNLKNVNLDKRISNVTGVEPVLVRQFIS
jgi:hypothetical protein